MVFEYAKEDDFKAKCLEKKQKKPKKGPEIKILEPEIKIIEDEIKIIEDEKIVEDHVEIVENDPDKYRAIALGIRPRGRKSNSDLFSKNLGNFEPADQELLPPEFRVEVSPQKKHVFAKVFAPPKS